MSAPPGRLRHAFAYAYLRANKGDVGGLARILGLRSLKQAIVYTRKDAVTLRRAMSRVDYQ